jgi:hypothetical protein
MRSKPCRFCSEKISDGAVICSVCGADRRPREATEQRTLDTRPLHPRDIPGALRYATTYGRETDPAACAPVRHLTEQPPAHARWLFSDPDFPANRRRRSICMQRHGALLL